nr:unnamed protein product [Macaca fascicularis]
MKEDKGYCCLSPTPPPHTHTEKKRESALWPQIGENHWDSTRLFKPQSPTSVGIMKGALWDVGSLLTVIQALEPSLSPEKKYGFTNF